MSESKKIILVTGGTGLVGKAIETVIREENPQNETWIFLSSKDGDLSKLEEAEKIFNYHKPTHVIHLAAMVGGLFYNMDNNLDFLELQALLGILGEPFLPLPEAALIFKKNGYIEIFCLASTIAKIGEKYEKGQKSRTDMESASLRVNLAINDNVLSCSNKSGVLKAVSCLSTCIFPDKTSYPIDETMVHNGPPHPSNFGYSHAKRLIDVLNQAYYQKHQRMYTSVIPCNIYGPHDNYDLKSSHVIPALTRKLHDVIDANGDTWTVFGSGKPLRQFIYSEDLARLMIWALRHYQQIDPIILSVDESDEVSIGDVARYIAEAAGFTGTIKFDTTMADGQFKKTASNKKLRSYLPDFQFTPIKEGIRKSVEWFKLNRHSARL